MKKSYCGADGKQRKAERRKYTIIDQALIQAAGQICLVPFTCASL